MRPSETARETFRAWGQRWPRWASEAVLVLILFAGVQAWQARGHLAHVQVPSTALPSLHGGSLSLASLEGRPTLVAIWAPWCGVCKAESQNLSWLKALVGTRANVVAVATGYNDVSEVRAFVQEHDATYPVLLGNDEVLRDFRVHAFPTLYFLDSHGRVKRSTVGYTTLVGMLVRLVV